jgi:hypothetical protein
MDGDELIEEKSEEVVVELTSESTELLDDDVDELVEDETSGSAVLDAPEAQEEADDTALDALELVEALIDELHVLEELLRSVELLEEVDDVSVDEVELVEVPLVELDVLLNRLDEGEDGGEVGSSGQVNATFAPAFVVKDVYDEKHLQAVDVEDPKSNAA